MARHVPECPSCGGPDYVPHDRDDCARKMRERVKALESAIQATRTHSCICTFPADPPHEPLVECGYHQERRDQLRASEAKVLVYESDANASYAAGKSFMRGQLEPQLERLMAYVDAAKVAAAPLGRVSGEPLDHFIRGLEVRLRGAERIINEQLHGATRAECPWNTKPDRWTYRYCCLPKDHDGEHDFGEMPEELADRLRDEAVEEVRRRLRSEEMVHVGHVGNLYAQLWGEDLERVRSETLQALAAAFKKLLPPDVMARLLEYLAPEQALLKALTDPPSPGGEAKRGKP